MQKKNLNRRKFITCLTAAGISTAVPSYISFAAGGQHKLKNIGFISGILSKNIDANNWKEVLRKTVEMGYTEYEGSVKGDSPKAFADFCRSIGLTPVAGGIEFKDDPDKQKEDMDKLLEMGMKYAVSYWPWFTGGPFMLEDCKKSVDILNRTGELAKNKGLTFCWHNHDKEFFEMEKGIPFDYLMNNTDKDLVSCEMDIYWVAKGGGNPVEALKRHSGRIPILHVKDMTGDAEKTFACPGEGVIDFPSVFEEARKQGIQHYFCERDNAADGLECLKTSAEYLLQLRF